MLRKREYKMELVVFMIFLISGISEFGKKGKFMICLNDKIIKEFFIWRGLLIFRRMRLSGGWNKLKKI